jgi:hypothetical protein
VLNCDGRLLLADAPGQNWAERYGVVAVGSTPGALVKHVVQSLIALVGPVRAALASGDVVARAALRPRRQIQGVGKMDMSAPISAMMHWLPLVHPVTVAAGCPTGADVKLIGGHPQYLRISCEVRIRREAKPVSAQAPRTPTTPPEG